MVHVNIFVNIALTNFDTNWVQPLILAYAGSRYSWKEIGHRQHLFSTVKLRLTPYYQQIHHEITDTNSSPNKKKLSRTIKLTIKLTLTLVTPQILTQNAETEKEEKINVEKDVTSV